MDFGGKKLIDNECEENCEVYKNEKTLINFTFFVACKNPQSAAHFLYSVLKGEEKKKLFPILRERIAELLEQHQCHYEAALLRTINIEE